MKQYVIDELRTGDAEALRAELEVYHGPSALEGVYWIPLEAELLSDVQAQHTECQPFYFALELENRRLTCELLVRTHQRIRCQCIGYADEAQRNWIIRFVDALFGRLGIHT